MKEKKALMICTQARGGMRSVVEAYERDGVLQRWNFEFLWTHREGSMGVRLGTAFSAYMSLLRRLLTGQVSFMHVHSAMRGSFWRKSVFAETARWFGVPSILHLHGSEMKTFYGALSPARQWAVRRSLEKAACVVVLSESWRQFVLGVAPRAHITVINNYVSVPSEIGQATPAGRVAQTFTVLFLGLLGQRKGIYDLLDCWPGVLAAVPGARLQVGGNGELAAAKARAQSLGIADSVDFMGWIDGEQKLGLLKNCDAFVLPSYNEGLPMSVLEAMSWAKPVITTRVGGIPELITHGEDGLLINPGDLGALSAALVRLGQDAQLRAALGNQGRQRIQAGFCEAAILPKLENVYRQMLNRHGGAATGEPVGETKNKVSPVTKGWR